jgi:putative phosphoesterase
MSPRRLERVGLISDIHGNYPALLAVIEALDANGVDRIACLGDTAGYYPQINECIELLRERNISSVMGNHDWYLSGGHCLRSNIVNICIDYQKSIITSSNLNWLKSLPVEIEKYGIRMVHGGWSDPLDEYLKPNENYFLPLRGKYFASGHSHVPQIFSSEGKVWCNPGSVGQPRDANPQASFAIFDGTTFQIHRAKYDVMETINKCKLAGLPNKVYGGLQFGSKTLMESPT